MPWEEPVNLSLICEPDYFSTYGFDGINFPDIDSFFSQIDSALVFLKG